MNKPLTGIVVGAVLGLIDGSTAWFTPDARPMMQSILMGSCVKGMVVGIVSGLFARKVHSDKAGIALGAGLGLILAYLVAATEPPGQHHYLEIMLPGFITGAIIGFLTQRSGNAPAPTETRS